jgi:TRAP-type C4-dicarboxylate transport system permease small subunit
MNPSKLAAIVLIVCGALGLAYGGFTYTKDTHTADIGAMHLTVNETERVYVPVWVGLGALVMGVLLLGVPRKA